MKKKKLGIAIAAVLSLIVLFGTAAGIYVGSYYRASEEAVACLAGKSNVSVEKLSCGYAFVPEEPRAGLVFYPGGKVEYTAYSPLMESLADSGVLCVLMEMPLNLAVFDVDAADGVPELFPDVKNWYIGGHSLGGAMAAVYASENANDYRGLVLLAAYSTADLTDSGLDVITVYGTEDGVLDMQKLSDYSVNLPDSAQTEVIEGGCHAYFGSYGNQSGDGAPTITQQEQIRETTALLTGFMKINGE